jgi:1,4-dihydroxy-2-naphthoate octaprenyltransferase
MFEQITDTLGTVTDTVSETFGGETPPTQLNVVTDEEMRRRTIVRVIAVVVILSLVTLLIYKRTKK